MAQPPPRQPYPNSPFDAPDQDAFDSKDIEKSLSLKGSSSSATPVAACQVEPVSADDVHVVGDAKQMSLLKSPMVRVAPFIISTEACERLAYVGIARSIVTYMTSVLNMSNSQASSMTNIWSGTCYITPLLGAFLADAWWGRYRTILVFSTIYLGGFWGLTASSKWGTPAAGQAASGGDLALFWIMMYLIALGMGGIKPLVSTFGADQFNEKNPAEARLIPRFFNWFYAVINIGCIIATTIVVNVQTSVSWTVGSLIPAAAFAVAFFVFVVATPLYRRLPASGSPLSRFARVVGGAFAHFKAKVPEDASELNEAPGKMSAVRNQPKMARTPSFKFLEKACTHAKPRGTLDRWLVTLTEVEEFKCILRFTGVWITLVMYHAIYAQLSTTFILQGTGMDCHLGSLNVSPATVAVLNSISVLIWVGLYDLLIDPLFRKWGRPIKPLTRIGIGYLVAVLSMLCAALVDIFRQRSVDAHGLQGCDPSTSDACRVPMSVWWQIPQYFFVGMSEVFSLVGAHDLFYANTPDLVRSVSAALNLLSMSVGSYVSAALVAIIQATTATNGSTGWIADNVNDAKFQYWFLTLMVLILITWVAYIFIARRFRYREVPHATFDPAALGLEPDGRAGLAFANPALRELSKEIDAGLPRHLENGRGLEQYWQGLCHCHPPATARPTLPSTRCR
ncbi:hypothetical protein ABPG75_008079 [Micractinium tetrahymenae]